MVRHLNSDFLDLYACTFLVEMVRRGSPASPHGGTSGLTSFSSRPRGRRERANTLVSRLHASPVKLYPLSLHDGVESGNTESAFGVGTSKKDDGSLGPRSVCVVVSQIDAVMNGEAGRRYCYNIAAQHLARGGCATLILAPGSHSFCLPLFLMVLEMHWIALHPAEETGDSITEGYAATEELQSRQAAVLAAMQHFDVISCVSLYDLQAVCIGYEFRHLPVQQESSSSGSAVTDIDSGATPLVVFDGISESTSYLAMLERAAGQPVPLSHWVLCHLQRRLRCAVVVHETRVSTEGLRPSSSVNVSASLPSTDEVVAQSPFLSAMHSPHHHSVVTVGPEMPSDDGKGRVTVKVEGAKCRMMGDDRKPSCRHRTVTSPRRRGAAPSANGALQSPVTSHDLQLWLVYMESNLCTAASLPSLAAAVHGVKGWTSDPSRVTLARQSTVHLMRITLREVGEVMQGWKRGRGSGRASGGSHELKGEWLSSRKCDIW